MKTLFEAIILTFGFLSDLTISSQNTDPITACNQPEWLIQLIDTGGKGRSNGVFAAPDSYRNPWDTLNENVVPDIPIPSISRLKIEALDADKISVYPNPFSSTTSIDYSLPFKARVTLSIYDKTGKEVVFLNEGWKRAGLHNTTFIRGKLANGTYDFKLILHSQGNKAVRSGILMIR